MESWILHSNPRENSCNVPEHICFCSWLALGQEKKSRKICFQLLGHFIISYILHVVICKSEECECKGSQCLHSSHQCCVCWHATIQFFPSLAPGGTNPWFKHLTPGRKMLDITMESSAQECVDGMYSTSNQLFWDLISGHGIGVASSSSLGC